ncbi:hypothetical protein AABB24_003132, partial [Solanum stoloniferum]
LLFPFKAKSPTIYIFGLFAQRYVIVQLLLFWQFSFSRSLPSCQMLTSCKISEEAPRYLKTLPEVGKLTNISRNGNPSKKQVENIDENHEEKERENPILLVEPIPNEDCKVNSGVELGTSEVEYIESENLKDVEDVDMSLKTLLGELESKD